MLQSTVIILTSVFVLAISFFLFKIASGTMELKRLHTISYVFYVQLVISAYVGSVLVATGIVSNHYMLDPVSETKRIEAWLWVSYSMLMMPLAMIWMNQLLNVRIRQRLLDYMSKDIEVNYGPVLSRIVLSFMVLIAVFAVFYIVYYTKNIPIYTLLIEGDAESALVHRVAARREFMGVHHIKNWLGILLTPIFSYYAYVQMREKRELFYSISFVILLLLSIFVLTYDIQKATVVFYLLGYVILTVLYKGQITYRIVFLAIFSAFVILIMGYVYTGGRGFIQLFYIQSAFYGRIFISGYGGFPLSLELFHDVIKESTVHIGIPTFVLNYFDLSTTESARLLMEYINPEGVALGQANLISSFYMAEAYANYGYIGLLISPFVVGVVIHSLHLFAILHKKDALVMAFYSYLTIRWLLNAGFVNFLYLKIVLYPLLLFLLIKILINTLIKLSSQAGYNKTKGITNDN